MSKFFEETMQGLMEAVSISKSLSDNYISNRAWLREVVGGKQLVLRGVSALEYLQLFGGYINETIVEAYALIEVDDDSLDCRVIHSFEEIEYFVDGNVRCATFNQILNDMLAEFEIADELALVEALANYFHLHDQSFDGLVIKEENEKIFEDLKEQAKEYYCGG